VSRDLEKMLSRFSNFGTGADAFAPRWRTVISKTGAGGFAEGLLVDALFFLMVKSIT
jgi:hypothetical protein